MTMPALGGLRPVGMSPITKQEPRRGVLWKPRAERSAALGMGPLVENPAL